MKDSLPRQKFDMIRKRCTSEIQAPRYQAIVARALSPLQTISHHSVKLSDTYTNLARFAP